MMTTPVDHVIGSLILFDLKCLKFTPCFSALIYWRKSVFTIGWRMQEIGQLVEADSGVPHCQFGLVRMARKSWLWTLLINLKNFLVPRFLSLSLCQECRDSDLVDSPIWCKCYVIGYLPFWLFFVTFFSFHFP